MLEPCIFFILLLAILIDAIVGDPDFIYLRLKHPVQLMGLMISYLDKKLNKQYQNSFYQRISGIILIIFLLILTALFGLVLKHIFNLIPHGWILEAFIISSMIAAKSLYQHVKSVQNSLETSTLDEARLEASKIVGRNTKNLDNHGVARSAIESLSENFSDGIIAPIFWTVILGLPGILAYKMLNTADSMIGHKNHKYIYFGWASARLDDIANFIPARISALLFCIVASFSGRAAFIRSFKAVHNDAKKLDSINSGYPEAAMAGALNLILAGPRLYSGEDFEGNWIGDSVKGSTSNATHKEIGKALSLYTKACILSFLLVTVIALFFMERC